MNEPRIVQGGSLSLSCTSPIQPGHESIRFTINSRCYTRIERYVRTFVLSYAPRFATFPEYGEYDEFMGDGRSLELG